MHWIPNNNAGCSLTWLGLRLVFFLVIQTALKHIFFWSCFMLTVGVNYLHCHYTNSFTALLSCPLLYSSYSEASNHRSCNRLLISNALWWFFICLFCFLCVFVFFKIFFYNLCVPIQLLSSGLIYMYLKIWRYDYITCINLCLIWWVQKSKQTWQNFRFHDADLLLIFFVIEL